MQAVKVEEDCTSIDITSFITSASTSVIKLAEIDVEVNDPLHIYKKYSVDQEFHVFSEILKLKEILNAAVAVLKMDNHISIYSKDETISSVYLDIIHELIAIDEFDVFKHSAVRNPSIYRIAACVNDLFHRISLAHDTEIKNMVFTTSISRMYFQMAIATAVQLAKYYIEISLNNYSKHFKPTLMFSRVIADTMHEALQEEIPSFNEKWMGWHEYDPPKNLLNYSEKAQIFVQLTYAYIKYDCLGSLLIKIIVSNYNEG